MSKPPAPNRKKSGRLTILPAIGFSALAAALLGAVMSQRLAPDLASTLFFLSLGVAALTAIQGGGRK